MDINFFNDLEPHLSESIKTSVVTSLEKLLEKERLEAPEFKIENYSEFSANEFNNRFGPFFVAHNKLIDEVYPPANDAVFKISDKLFIAELLDHLSGIETSKLSDFTKNNHKCDQIFATNPLADYGNDNFSYSEKGKKLISEGYDDGTKYFIIKEHPLIQKLHKLIRVAIKGDVRSPFAIVNTRAWSVAPKTCKLGAFRNHNDGFLPGHLKIMVYLNPMSRDHGYLIINENEIIGEDAGTCILFRNSDIEHRGVPPEMFERICFEITIQRTFINIEQHHDGHPIGRHYASLNRALTTNLDDGFSIKFKKDESLEVPTEIKINIGSGPDKWPGWINYDEVIHEGVTPLTLTPDVTIPLEANSVSLAYSSHNLEHLPDDTVSRILDEIWGVMRDDGIFILKLPDFDWFLDQYQKGNNHAMEGVGTESIIWSWASKGMVDSFENRVSVYFCGYWNTQYGDHFSKAINRTKEAYHGPAVVNNNDLKNILSTKSPHEIAKALTKIARLDPDFKTFNHQNAWSIEEMSLMLKEKGFSVLSTDKDEIVRRFNHVVPRFKEMFHFSSYYVIKKNIS